MRRHGVFLLSLLVAALLLGCANRSGAPAPPAGPASYFPLTLGAMWARRATDGGKIVATVVGRRTIGAAACTVVETKTVRNSQGRVTRVCYEVTAARVRAIETEGQGRTVVLDPPRTVLLLPPQAGTSWSWSPRAPQVPLRIEEEWVAEEPVTVAAGTFRAWKAKTVTTQGNLAATLFTWYAPGVGIVKITRVEQQGQLQREGGSELVSYTIP